jgi:hypothetical protein
VPLQEGGIVIPQLLVVLLEHDLELIRLLQLTLQVPDISLEAFLFGDHAFNLESLLDIGFLEFVKFVDSQLKLILDPLDSVVTFLDRFRPKDEVTLQGFPAFLEHVDP